MHVLAHLALRLLPLAFVGAWFPPLRAYASDTPCSTNAWAGLAARHAPTQALLARNTIRVEGAGALAVNFADAVRVLAQSNLLTRVQEEYARSLPEGQKPEFVLTPMASNAWSFVNRKNQYSEVHEIGRAPLGTNGLMTAFYSKGERFFGDFESATVIAVTADGPGRVRYDVRVFAFPHQVFCRFVARHLGLVERFFRGKTAEIEGIATRVCRRLCNAPPADG